MSISSVPVLLGVIFLLIFLTGVLIWISIQWPKWRYFPVGALASLTMLIFIHWRQEMISHNPDALFTLGILITCLALSMLSAAIAAVGHQHKT